MPGEAEREGAAGGERAAAREQGADGGAEGGEVGARGGRRAVPFAEEVAGAGGGEGVGARVADGGECAVEGGEGACAFGGVEPAGGGDLARAGEGGVPGAERGEGWGGDRARRRGRGGGRGGDGSSPGCPTPGVAREEIEAWWDGERVADADVVVEVGERGDGVRVGDVAFDDDGEPEAELAEPDGRAVDVDAEDGAGEDGLTAVGEGARVVARGEEVGEALEGVDEESAGAAGRVEEAERLDAGAESRRLCRGWGCAGEGGGDRVARWGVVGEGGSQRGGGRVLDQGARSVWITRSKSDAADPHPSLQRGHSRRERPRTKSDSVNTAPRGAGERSPILLLRSARRRGRTTRAVTLGETGATQCVWTLNSVPTPP